MDIMEVFGGLEDLFSGKEKEIVDSFFNANNVGVLETIVSRKTNPNNNVVVSADLQEQVSNDETDEEMVDPPLDEDLDEVMANFLKRNLESEQTSEEMISQKDDEALTVAALLDLEQNLVVHDGQKLVVVLDDEEQGVHQNADSRPTKKNPVVHVDDDVESHEAVPGVFIPSEDDPWRTPSSGASRNFVGNNSWYHKYRKYLSWNARYANRVSGRISDPSSWSDLTTPGGVTEKPSSLPFSGSGTRPSLLLGGVVDVASLLNNNTSWGNHHPHAVSNSSSSSTSPGGGGAQWTEFENLMSQYQRCNSKLSKGSNCKLGPVQRRKRKEKDVKLPPGWEVVRRVRKNGKSKGQIDKYYLNRETNQRCRSLPELYRLLNLPPNGLEE